VKRYIRPGWVIPTNPFEQPKIIEFNVDDEGMPPLAVCYEHVECDLIQLVRIPGLGDLIVDEEGLMAKKSPNVAATLLFQIHTGCAEVLVGKALLLRTGDLSPENGAVADADEDETFRVTQILERTREISGTIASLISQTRTSELLQFIQKMNGTVTFVTLEDARGEPDA
jgi:hypothetical protein